MPGKMRPPPSTPPLSSNPQPSEGEATEDLSAGAWEAQGAPVARPSGGRLGLGILLMSGGGLIVAGGVIFAILSLGSLYNRTVADPLGLPDGTEKQAQASMYRGVTIAGVGVIPMIAGVFLTRRATARSAAAKRREKSSF